MRSSSRTNVSARQGSQVAETDSSAQCVRHTRLFESMAQGVVYHDDQGRIIAANPAAERILGYTLEQMLGQTMTDPRWKAMRTDGSDFPAEDHPSMVALHRGEAVSEIPIGIFHSGLGQYRWILVNATPHFRSGASHPYEVFTTFSDITDYKRAKDELLQTRQKLEVLQNVVDSLPQRLFWKDRNGSFRGCNRAGAKAFGLQAPDEICGKTDYDFYANHSDGDFFFKQDLGAMENGASVYHTLAEKQESAGEIRWLDVTKVPLRDSRGNIDGLLVSYEDVTNFNQIEQSLQKFKQVVEQSPASIIITDRDGNIGYVNPAFCHGYGYSAQEVMGLNPRILKSKQSTPDEWRMLWDCILSGQTWRGEFLNQTKDGSLIWQSAMVSPVLDENGEITNFISIQEDISERKQMEISRKKDAEDLFNTKQLMQLVLDHIPQQVFWKDIDSVYIGANATYLETFGLSSITELKGKTDFDWHTPEFARKYRKDDRNVMRKNRPRINYEETMLSIKGELRWVGTSKVPLHDQSGQVIGVLGIFEDISERKTMQRELAHTLQQLHTILDNAQVGIAYLRENRFIWINRRMEEMFGFQMRAICEKSPEVFFISPEDYLRINEQADFTLSQGKPFEIEHLMKSKRGRVFWCHIRGMAVDKRSKEKGSIWIMMDIESRKAAEQRLNEINITLTQRVFQEIANGMEKERLLIHQSRHAAMGEMIGNIAHQWRQPLSVLGLILQNIAYDFEGKELTKAVLDAYVADAMHAIRQMSGTIDDFRDFFRPNRQKTVFNIRQAVAETFALISASLKSHDINVNVSGPENIEICGHQNEFSQMLLNLIGNAKDALVENKPEQPEIDIEINFDGEYATIAVHDNAGGVPPEIKEKIFDPYFTTKENGTGIGLYMTKTLIEKHMHGTIALRNGEKGAEFIITLPLAESRK